MKVVLKIFFILIIIFCVKPLPNYALEVGTHRAINENVSTNMLNDFSLDSYLKNQLGFTNGINKELKYDKTRKVWEWLSDGGEYEDKPPRTLPYVRSVNHFHNPLKAWNEAGLYDVFQGKSSVVWAQDQSSATIANGGDWSWVKARENFHIALTGKDFNGNVVASTQAEKEAYFAKTFRAVGQVMHLVEDASVPAHVRNDSHIAGDGYEDWVEYTRTNNKTLFKSFMAAPVSFDPSILTETLNPLAPLPIARIIDANAYNTNPNITTNKNCSVTKSIICSSDSNCPTNEICVSTIGISEYANANFASDDTIFTDGFASNDIHYFPYPRYSAQSYEMFDLEISPDKKRGYLRKTGDGEAVEFFATFGPLYKYLSFDPVLQRDELELDEECFNNYASLLIPRAVGYSAGLLDYFFRGNIEITLPSSGIYAQTNDPGAGFTSIKLLAKNTTPNDEQMTNGSIELVVKYKRAISDPFRNYLPSDPFYVENNFSYIVAPEFYGVNSIPRDNSVWLTFDLTNNPIPSYAIDVYLFVVFKGRLGNEEGAVAVGLKDISEPTPIDFWNDTDRVCLNGNLVDNPEAIAYVDDPANGGNNNGFADEWDVYAHDISNIYTRISPIGEPYYASPSSPNNSFVVPSLAAGTGVNGAFILTDYGFNEHDYSTWVGRAGDPWQHSSVSGELWANPAIKNQTDYVEDSATCAPLSAPCSIWWYPSFLEYRNYYIWWGGGLMYINNAYPAGSECDCYEGILRSCPAAPLSPLSISETRSSQSELMQQDGAVRIRIPVNSEGGISAAAPPTSP
ncbi:MAG: hypothetical protein HZC48_11925 [Nitrospirae bacterium]|nr:hypothetical protein [Nitrospirota bacterium]